MRVALAPTCDRSRLPTKFTWMGKVCWIAAQGGSLTAGNVEVRTSACLFFLFFLFIITTDRITSITQQLIIIVLQIIGLPYLSTQTYGNLEPIHVARSLNPLLRFQGPRALRRPPCFYDTAIPPSLVDSWISQIGHEFINSTLPPLVPEKMSRLKTTRVR
jgi:hypothetical protein